jgi:hypothetical protein
VVLKVKAIPEDDTKENKLQFFGTTLEKEGTLSLS